MPRSRAKPERIEVPGLKRPPADIGKVYAAGATWATDRAQRLHTAAGVITGNQDDIVIITRSGIEALLRDAYAAGHYLARKQE